MYFTLNISIQANEIKGFHKHLDFKTITKADGLSQSRVTCSAYDDSKGLFWLGTNAGINTYDGYNVDATPDILQGEYSKVHIQNCDIDKHNNVYFALYTNGLLKIGHDGTVSHFNHTNTSGWNEQTSIYDVIPVSDHEVWLASNSGLIKLDTKQHTARVFFPKKIASNDITKLDNYIYIASKNGFFSFDINNNTLVNISSQYDINQNFHTVFSSKGGIYAGNFSDGIFELNLSDNTLKRVESSSNEISLGIAKIDNTLFYSANNQGLSIQSLINKELQTYTVDNSELAGNSVYQIKDYPDLNIITFASRGGFSIVNKSQLLVDNYKYNKTQTGNFIPNNSVWSLAELHSTLWLATGGGIVKYSFDKQHHQVYSKSNNKNISNSVWTIHIDKSNDVWAATSSGLAKYNPSLDKFERVELTTTGEVLDVISIENYLDKGLWVGTFGKGLYRYSFNGDVKAFLPDPKNKKSIISSGILSLKEIEHELWLGGSVNGAAKFSYLTEEFTHYPSKIHGGTFKSSYVRQVFQTANGIIWFANDSGLYYLNNEQKIVKDELIGDALIYCMASDSYNNLYLGTNEGLIYYQVDNKQYTLLKEDGLQSNEYNGRACKQLSSGKLAFGGIAGLSIFDDTFTQDIITRDNPEILVKDYQSGDENISFNHAENLFKLDEDADFVEISLSNRLFYHHFNTKYSYSINGDTLNDITSFPLKVATNFLPNGSTELTIFAKSRFTNNAEPIKVLQINRAYYWWQTLWGKILVTMVTLSVITGIYLLRVNRLKKHNFLMEEEIQKKTMQLREVLKEKESLFENVSHELKTPLTLILGRSEQLLKRDDVTTATATELTHIAASAEQLYQLVNQLLQLAEVKHQKNKKEAIDIVEQTMFVCDSLSSLAANAGTVITFKLDSLMDSHWLEIQTGAWSSIITNLITNAIKYGDNSQPVQVLLNITEEITVLSVSNKGAKIEPEKLEQIFNRFEQVNVDQQGQGLGLAIVKELTKNHFGDTEVTSNVGEVVFTVTIPNVKNKPSQVTNTNLVTAEPETENKLTAKQNILIVEDNQELREFIASALSLQFAITAVEHGQAAINWLTKNTLPDLILSDVMMPVMDGYQLCEKLKQDPIYQYIPLFLLTAKADIKSTKKGLALAADDYIAKPFNTDVLITKIGNQLATHAAMKKHFQGKLLSSANKLKDETPLSDSEVQLNTIRQALSEHYNNADIKASDIAQVLHSTEKTLNRKLQVILGKSISELLREFRLNQAKQLLAQGHKAKSVYFECGFNSMSYFSQSYKKEFGQSPRDFQKQQVSVIKRSD
ncbi:MAG: response regulator [Reichenbachiella sp.]